MRRLAVVASLVLAILAVDATAAGAKVPPFEMEVSATTVAPGDPITVTITLDPQAGDFPAEELTGLIGFGVRPPEGVTRRPLTEHHDVPLPRVGEGVYEGTIEAPAEPGAYVITPFPTVLRFEDSPVSDRYPTPIEITVTNSPTLAKGSVWSLALVVGLAGLVIVGRRYRSAVGSVPPRARRGAAPRRPHHRIDAPM